MEADLWIGYAVLDDDEAFEKVLCDTKTESGSISFIRDRSEISTNSAESSAIRWTKWHHMAHSIPVGCPQ